MSGPPGSGRQRSRVRSLGCPAVCRDEIKEWMMHSTPGSEASTGDRLTQRTLTVFFDVLATLLRAGVTVVAEPAFQDKPWRPNLEPRAEFAAIRVVRCTVDNDVAHERIVRRAERAASGACRPGSTEGDGPRRRRSHRVGSWYGRHHASPHARPLSWRTGHPIP
ncbi:AAA family ATPase [Planotetraspora kaengkrachanensis]|uniref:AAA family ATPase n=1 Tax=Planotetraspora kaengkrachanensis TaxID=575193 RepID=UPI0035712DB5